MGADQNIAWTSLAASALEWWHDAGVDTLVQDDPREWLKTPAIATAPVARAVAPQQDALPDTIEAFLAWRIGDAAPEAKWPGVKIVATGPVDAALMVLVDCPETDDRETLMEGATGRLFDRMLAAIGQSRATVRLASVCASRPIGRRTPGEVATRLGEIAQHHVALVAPQRLIVMGDAASRAVLGMDVGAARGRLQPLNHKSGTGTGVVSTYHPRLLVERPGLKAEAWKDLQLAVRGMTS